MDPSWSLARLVREHPATAEPLRVRGLDFCCRGETTLAEACAAAGLSLAALLADLERAALAPTPAGGPRPAAALDTPALVAHIVGTHHAFLRQALPRAGELVRKVARVHGEHDPRLRELAQVVGELEALLPPHLREEEEVLFPALLAGPGPDRERLLDAMRADHLAVGERLARLRALSDGFAPPAWACASYTALLDQLERLEQDTLQHVHLENHVLAPRGAPSPRSP